MSLVMYKSNRTQKDKSFWGKKDIFYDGVCFDKNKAIEYFNTLRLDQSDQCLFLEDFIKFYNRHKINDLNVYWFNKSLEFIKEVSGITNEILYKFTIEHISQFEQKEDFEIFYYFKNFDILQNGFNNIFAEVLNWFSYNENHVNVLLSKSHNTEPEVTLSQFFFMETTKSGKSLYVKTQLLKDNCIIISQKEMKLNEFKEDDKEYFYNFLMKLTIDNNACSVLKKVENNKDIELKGIARYIEKRLIFESLSQKMLLKEQKNYIEKNKKIKI